MENDKIFSRNIICWGNDVQLILKKSSVLIAGMGGLGCCVAQLLVRAGIGRLIILDHDKVSIENLNRQILFDQDDLGSYKVHTARKKLQKINPKVDIIPLQMKLQEARDLFNIQLDMVLDGFADCLDNYSSRFILEEALNSDQFMVHGGVRNNYGQITTIKKSSGISLKNIYDNLEDGDEIIGVIPQTVTAIGSLMTEEIINNILGKPELEKILLVLELKDFNISRIILN